MKFYPATVNGVPTSLTTPEYLHHVWEHYYKHISAPANHIAHRPATKNAEERRILDDIIARDPCPSREERLICDPEARRETAFHEASHAVVLWAFSGPGHVELLSLADKPRGNYGFIRMHLPAYLPSERRTTELRMMAVLSAGRVGQDLYLNSRASTGLPVDIRHPDGDAGDLEDMGGVYGEGAMSPCDPRVERAQEKATQMLRDNWRVVVAVADALNRHGELSGPEFDALARRASY